MTETSRTTPEHSGTIWIGAGEASGDLHGAQLLARLREQRPGLRFTGMGGPAMAEAGFEPLYSMDLISLVGITEVLGGLRRILRLLRGMRRKLSEVRPEAIVLIDCPDFHFRVAKIAAKLGIPVYYYISPQVWAWRSGRVEFLKKYVRRVLCILPFEKDFYAERGMEADYVGHPLLDELPCELLETVEPEPRRVGLLPGSRRKEVASLLPVFAETARRLAVDVPGVRFSLVRAPGMDENLLRAHWPDDLPVEVIEPRDRYAGMKRCAFVIAASGTVTLESALMGTPAIVAYKLSPLSFAVGRRVVNVPYVSLPNLILGKEAFPELLQDQATPDVISARARLWLTAPGVLDAVRGEVRALRRMVGEPGAAGRAAAIILDDLAAARS